MNDEKIKQLLDAYYNGTATREEEQDLVAFFLGDQDVPERWKEAKRTFLLVYHTAQIPLPEGLEERLVERLDKQINKNKRIALNRTLYRITAIAAVALLCVGIAFYQGAATGSSKTIADTYTDPHEAAQVAGKALAFMSSNLNKGLEQVDDANKEIQEVNKILNQQLK